MSIRHNHARNILNRSYAPIKAIDPGMFIEFDYDKKNTFDPKPLVFVLWNDRLYASKGKGDLIHGININYLSTDLFRRVFNAIIEGTTELNIPYTENPEESDYDDKSSRNLIKKPITKVDLPYAGNVKGGRKLNMAQAQHQLNLLYEKQIKPFVKTLDIYRTYKIDKIKTLRTIQYDIGA